LLISVGLRHCPNQDTKRKKACTLSTLKGNSNQFALIGTLLPPRLRSGTEGRLQRRPLDSTRSTAMGRGQTIVHISSRRRKPYWRNAVSPLSYTPSMRTVRASITQLTNGPSFRYIHSRPVASHSPKISTASHQATWCLTSAQRVSRQVETAEGEVRTTHPLSRGGRGLSARVAAGRRA